jgi:23S rRNA (adenine2030-N6)-methyltransferase
MNYRHAFHAGNFADVVKHIVMARILAHLREKPTPFRVIDTHAGEGLYDLSGDEASRTGEWRDGIGRLAGATLPVEAAGLVAPYLAAVRACNIASELRYYPVKERRGLVIVDPPFEQPDDLVRLANGVMTAWRKWPTGVYLMWYPLKERAEVDRFAGKLRHAGIEKSIRFEFTVAAPRPDGGLQACGLVVVNPPWRLAAEIRIFAPVLVDVLGRDGGCGYSLDDRSVATDARA